MKKVVIYTTEDKVISLQLVYKIISNPKYKDFKFDIYLTKPKMLRKIKIFIVLFLFGSLKDFFKKLNHQTSVSKILKSNRNTRTMQYIYLYIHIYQPLNKNAKRIYYIIDHHHHGRYY